MTRRVDFFRTGLGCIADGSYGISHIRERLAELVKPYGRKGKALAARLSQDVSEASEHRAPEEEEDAAIDLLNNYTEDGIYFTMSNGDLLLVDESFAE